MRNRRCHQFTIKDHQFGLTETQRVLSAWGFLTDDGVPVQTTKTVRALVQKMSSMPMPVALLECRSFSIKRSGPGLTAKCKAYHCAIFDRIPLAGPVR